MINSTFDCVVEHVKSVKPSSQSSEEQHKLIVDMTTTTSQYDRQFNCEYFLNPSVKFLYFRPTFWQDDSGLQDNFK